MAVVVNLLHPRRWEALLLLFWLTGPTKPILAGPPQTNPPRTPAAAWQTPDHGKRIKLGRSYRPEDSVLL